GLGRALLRHQFAPIDPGGLGPQADLDHPEHRRPGPGDTRRTGRAGRRGPARYPAPAGAAAASDPSTRAAGAAVAIRRTSRGRVTGPFAWEAMQLANGKLRTHIKRPGHILIESRGFFDMRAAHGSRMERCSLPSSNRRGGVKS